MVAAISGYAVAGGFELALMCDLRVMEETAILGMYNRRFGKFTSAIFSELFILFSYRFFVGVPLIDGGTVRLQATVGLSRALDLILTGRSLNANEAFLWGVANRLVPCGTCKLNIK